MFSEVMNFFGLEQELDHLGFFATEAQTHLEQEISKIITQGRLIALSGIVGSGKTTFLQRLIADLGKAKEIAWNEWREDHPYSDIDLSEANLADFDINGANLSDADLTRVDLSEANLSRSKKFFGVREHGGFSRYSYFLRDCQNQPFRG
ncbi:MAG: pentapeptide repeat-containing protein [Pleurocapsa sp. MO_226.B13]|nr:pentapeptide repeat-containing protein [Pleurocapsa sp. MO_226.B13]